MANLVDTSCEKTVTKEELLAKLKGTPDFVLEEYYCKGAGAYCRDNDLCVQLVARSTLPTRFGTFTLYGFFDSRENKEHTAIVQGSVEGKERVPLRVHSECHTGDVWGSLRCDCRDQLETALRTIGQMENGILLYLRQEGRGIGFINKIRAYGLQDHGYDTVEANLALGFRDDERDYSVAAHMLNSLKVKSICLMTNNPRKIAELSAYGIHITDRIPLVIPPNPYNEFYLRTKAAKSGHMIEINGQERYLEQIDWPYIEGMTIEQVAALNNE